MTQPRPYLTRDLPGVGGRIKEEPEDFRVEELPLYTPCGEGTHVYAQVRKRGVGTPEALRRVARHMGVRPGGIGVAGLKDARAVTTQWMSLEHCDPARLAAFADEAVQVTAVARHTNKLRTGHLAGNRFTIRIRGVGAAEQPTAEAVLEVLRRRGVPNYYGLQRFGARGDSAELGRALLRRDAEAFVRLLLGAPRADDPPPRRAAREAFEAGDLEAALRQWPGGATNERCALAAYRRRGRAADAIAAVDKRLKRLYISAVQSELFNQVLARRIDEWTRCGLATLRRRRTRAGCFSWRMRRRRPRERRPSRSAPPGRCSGTAVGWPRASPDASSGPSWRPGGWGWRTSARRGR